MVTLYNVVSADGFISRKDGSEDFIPDELWAEFLSVCSKYDGLVLSAGAYKAIQTYDKKQVDELEALPVKRFVASSQDLDLGSKYTVTHSPEEIFQEGGKIIVSSGPTFNNYILKHKLAQKIILIRLNVKIANGLKPFDEMYEPSIELVKSEIKKDIKFEEYKII